MHFRTDSRAARVTALLLALTCLAGLCTAACADDGPIRGYDAKLGYVYVAVGSFPYEEDGTVRPIAWRVLSVQDGQAYCCTEYILINHRIDDTDERWKANGGHFRGTELWTWLNGEFSAQAFTEEELSLVVDTEDLGRFYLLSRDDLKSKAMGFGTDKSRKAWGTPWALAQVVPGSKKGEKALFRYRAVRGSHSPYWTLTQSSKKYAAICTKAMGNLGYIRVVVNDEGCRPAMRLDLGALTVTGGSGTLADPYTVAAKEVE